MSSAPVALDELNAAPQAAFVRTLAEIFENASWVADAASAYRPFATVADLHDAMMQAVIDCPLDRKRDFLRGHPELAGKAFETGAIAAASVSEQTGLGINEMSAEDAEEVRGLNAAYGQKFGFPFIVCVRRQTLDAMLAEFRRRLGNSREVELDGAIEEIRHITRLRLVDRVAGPGLPATSGHLSTHVLDTYHGEPASGVDVALYQVARRGRARLAEGQTNSDGRTDAPLLQDGPLRIGTYEIEFAMGAYFARRGVITSNNPFVGNVVLRFGIDQPEGKYHVPLVATPWSYSTYRGS